jgi:hypothetical protein
MFVFLQSFATYGAVYPFSWHLVLDRWVFVDQVRGVVLQKKGYLNLPPVSIAGSQ